MGNRFKNQIMRKTYDAMVKAYRTKHRDVIRPDGTPHKGNALSQNFWRGFNGTMHKTDRAYRQTPAYACFCAGMDMAAENRR